jgi:glycerol-3-phosphate cytidylyltransferase
MIVGYTCGVFDLFHAGHVEILRNARAVCDRLIVGLTTDEAVSYKGTEAVIPYEDRKLVLESCRYVDVVVPQEDHDKVVAHGKLKYDVLIVGDDWHGDEKWRRYEDILKEKGAEVVYFPYTKRTSTTMLKAKLGGT